MPTYIALDLWMALGLPPEEFETHTRRHTLDGTWAQMLDVIRRTHTPPCWHPMPGGDWCVLQPGHNAPHYGTEDTGPPNELLTRYLLLHT
jgi:hypothetical protein